MKKIFTTLLISLICLTASFSFADGIDENTVLMLHCDGTDESTTITDSSTENTKTVTASGNAQIDTAQSKFDGASCFFDGDNPPDYLDITADDDFKFGTGDWSVDFWIRWRTKTDSSGIFQTGTTENDRHTLQWYTNNNFYYDIKTAGTARLTLSVAFTPALDTWYHFEFGRSGTTYYMFKDGVSQTVNNLGGTLGWDLQIDANGTIGVYGPRITRLHDGWIDEMRVSNIMRHTANFDVPTEAYSVAVTGNVLKNTLRNTNFRGNFKFPQG